MKNYFFLNRKLNAFLAILTFVFLIACQPDENSQDNGLAAQNVDATFSVTPVEGVTNTYKLSVTNSRLLIGSKWDLGQGGNPYLGKFSEEVFIPDAGSYDITHIALAKGGATNSATTTLVVPTSDPISGNLITGGKFKNAADHSQWTVLNIGGSATNWTFNEGFANVSGSSTNSYSQKGIYQAVQVVANRKYKIDMRIFGSACTQTWFEVYASPIPPTQNNDYGFGGMRMGLSSWDGCANSNFDGLLSALKCKGSGNIVDFPQSGTVYLVIRAGGLPAFNMGTNGISITNVEFRAIKE